MFKFAIVCIILAVISLGVLIYPNFSHRMSYREPSQVTTFEHEKVDYKMSTGEIRNRIEDLVGIKSYWYSEKSMDVIGTSNLYLRHIIMDNTASQNDYVETFCHELLHIKYFTANDRFVNYKTFVTLYESEFMQVAINMAWEMQQCYVDREYDCLAQICDYLAQ